MPHIGYIDKLSVDLGVLVDKFEEELCQKVNQDRLKRDNITDDGKKVTVTERRLMVNLLVLCFYIGWTGEYLKSEVYGILRML